MDYATAPTRRGQAWLWDEFVRLAQELSDPALSLKEVAEAHQRTATAIQMAVHRALIPAGVVVADTAAFDWVRDKLTGPEPYHWEGVLVERLRGAGQDLVLPEAHKAMLAALDEGKKLAEIAAACGSSERKVAKRLVTLGLAYDVAEVVDVLGCEDSGLLKEAAVERSLPLPGRVTVLSALLWVYQPDGSIGFGWEQMPRVTLHRTGADAVAALAQVARQLTAEDVHGFIEYQIAHRGFDGSAAGARYGGDLPVGRDRAEIPRQPAAEKTAQPV